MLDKIIPVILVLVILQLLIRFLGKRKQTKSIEKRDFDYKKKIDEFLKVSNYDEGVNTGSVLSNELRSGLGKPEIIMNIPDNKRDVRRNLNLIIDAVSHGVKSKTGNNPQTDEVYRSPDKMFDEIIEVINRYKK